MFYFPGKRPGGRARAKVNAPGSKFLRRRKGANGRGGLDCGKIFLFTRKRVCGGSRPPIPNGSVIFGGWTMKKWEVFRDRETGRELCAYTIRGTFPGERAATIELLAAENGIEPGRIEVTIETRGDQ